MVTREQVEQVVLDSGLWEGSRRVTHGFILSPSVYQIDRERRAEFETVGVALRHCLAGLGRIAAIAANHQLVHSQTWHMIESVFCTSVPSVYHSMQILAPSSLPTVCKVDFLEDTNGKLRIAEIDAYNKHGLGYSTLAARMSRVIAPQAQRFPGVGSLIAQEVCKRNANELVLLYADQERFYLPEFLILQNELATLGVNLVVVAESDVSLESAREWKLLMDFPFLYHNQALNNCLAELYRNGEVNFLIPPKPFLGSKAMLALLRNDSANEELEAILRSQISCVSLELLRRYIPETYLLYKNMAKACLPSLINGKRFVLKESISSGMKGTVFSSDQHFEKTMQSACRSYYRFILQEEVANKADLFERFASSVEQKHHFEELHHCECYPGTLQDYWYKRVTAHYVMGEMPKKGGSAVGDIIVTARKDKKVHGATDCLQLRTVII